jgi:hypothetical protein
MNNIRETRIPVRRITTNHAEETLGVWIAPDGNTKTQCKKLLEKASVWADHLRTGTIRKEETWLALQTTIKGDPSVTHLMPLILLNNNVSKSCHQSSTTHCRRLACAGIILKHWFLVLQNMPE